MWLKNIWLKLTALALAVLLWFHVATNRVYNHTVQLELEPGPVPPGFALTAPLPGKITLIVGGTGKELIRFLWDGGAAKYLVEPTMSGPYVVSPDRLLLSMAADVQVEQVLDPTMVTVRVDSITAMRVPVRVNAEYTMGEGYALENEPRVIPDVVTVSGPSVNVHALSSIPTQPFQAGELRSPVELKAALNVQDVFNVRVQPDTVRVVFDVVAAMRKRLDQVPITVPHGFRAEPPSISVELSGAGNQLNSVSPSDIQIFVTLPGGFRGDTVVEPQVMVPTPIRILRVAPDHVRVYQP